MEIKNHPPVDGGEEKKEQAKIIKVKINGYLIKYFNYLAFSLSAVIIVIGFIFLLYPKYQQISKENQEVKNNLQNKYEVKLVYLNSIKNLKKSYQSITVDKRVKINSLIAPDRDTSLIIREIESFAIRNSAILTSIKIEPQVDEAKASLKVESTENKEASDEIFNRPPQGVASIKIDVNLSSVDYPVLKNIIKDFENNLRLFDIAKVNFDATKNEVSLVIYAYYFKSL